jgi:hypothetical protein
MVACTCHPSYDREHKIRLGSRPVREKREKLPKERGMDAWLKQCLLHKHKALSLKPSIAKKKK